MTTWRDMFKVHPAAELFPLMNSDELRVLGDDIKANGLKHQLIFWSETGECPVHDPKSQGILLDGRNRLDAMELVGVEINFDETLLHTVERGDPYAYVVSANIHRRHLTTAQKGELIEALLKADPSKSDRAIGKVVKADNKTVATRRTKLETTEEIPRSTARTGADGKTRKQPTKPAITAAAAAETADEETVREVIQTPPDVVINPSFFTGSVLEVEYIKSQLIGWWNAADAERRTEFRNWFFKQCFVDVQRAIEHPPTPQVEEPEQVEVEELIGDALILQKLRCSTWVGPAKLEELEVSEEDVERLLSAGWLHTHPELPNCVGVVETAA